MALSCSKNIISILRKITSKNNGAFYCLNFFHSSRTKNKLKLHKRPCENKVFCNVNMPSDDTKTLKFNQHQKPDKASFIIYADLECIIETIDGYKNNPENSSTVREHIPYDFSISSISSFRSTNNKHDVYRGKDCMKTLYEFLREH